MNNNQELGRLANYSGQEGLEASERHVHGLANGDENLVSTFARRWSIPECYAENWTEVHVHVLTRDARQHCAVFYAASVDEPVRGTLALPFGDCRNAPSVAIVIRLK